MEQSSLVTQRKFDRTEIVMGDAPTVNNLNSELVKCNSSDQGFGVVVLLPRDNLSKKPKEQYSNTFIIERVDGYMGIRLDRIVKDS